MHKINVFLRVNKNNHPSPPFRPVFSEWYNSAILNPLLIPSIETQKQRLKRFFCNVQHLCGLRGISECEYLKEVYKRTGFRVSQPFYSQLKHGKRVAASPYVFMVLAVCHGYDPLELMNEDLTSVTEVRKVA